MNKFLTIFFTVPFIVVCNNSQLSNTDNMPDITWNEDTYSNVNAPIINEYPFTLEGKVMSFDEGNECTH